MKNVIKFIVLVVLLINAHADIATASSIHVIGNIYKEDGEKIRDIVKIVSLKSPKKQVKLFANGSLILEYNAKEVNSDISLSLVIDEAISKKDIIRYDNDQINRTKFGLISDKVNKNKKLKRTMNLGNQ